MGLEKGAFHQKSWLGFTSCPCLWGLPSCLRLTHGGRTVPGTPEQALAFSVMAMCFLVPAGWVLAHLEHYKSRSD
uniref:Cytochrome c oxidase subunit 8A, mitochondrial n=1 Tax=Athene cunicularia TaxID=194338 RepID=A0A663M2V3_ATHCN